ncbi:Sensor histidine kinase LiaS [Sporomusa ovata DSM 2662]|nr:signal transduction histidine kinase, nitrate/nitrite-specific [Sporomusa ovata DSM 2662]
MGCRYETGRAFVKWFLGHFCLADQPAEKNMDTVTKYSLGSTLFLALLLLSNWQELIWQSAWLDGQAVVLVWGIGHVVMIGHVLMLCILATILSVRWVVTSAGLRRQQAWSYSLAVAVSWLSYALWRFGVRADIILPIGFLLNGAIVAWIYYYLQLYNILPLAKTVAVENVVEGIFFVDKEDYIVAINARAQTMLSGLPVSIGADFKATAAAWPALGEVDSRPGVQMLEAERQQPLHAGWYQLTKIPLQKSVGQPSLGRVILVKDITSQKQDQAQLIEQQNALAILTERNRLGREIHDGSGQIWNYLLLELKSLSLLMANKQTEDAAKLVERLEGILRDVHDDVRESIVSLNSGKVENHDFMTTLQEYFRWYKQAYSIDLVLDLPDKPLENFISKNIEVQLMRIIQEALTNIRKHAKASQAQISMRAEGENFVVVISDNGCSFEPATDCSIGHYGLSIMKERAEAVGGQLIIESTLVQGTKIKIIFSARGSYGETQNSTGG